MRIHRFALATLAAASLSLGLGQLASAADMPVKAAPRPLVAAYNWTGFYIGGNVGWASRTDSGTSNFTQPAPVTSNPQSQSLSNSKFIGGGQIGYNWQFAPNLMAGVEADWQWANPNYSFCRQTDPGSLACSDNGRGFETISSSTKWLATGRARLGWTWDRFVVYGTGGVAWGRVDTTLTANCSSFGCGNSVAVNTTSVSFSDTKAGWTAGAGLEAMLAPNWTVRGEWLHVDLGTVTNAFTSSVATGSYGVSWSRSVRFELFRFGVNYMFAAR